MNAKHTPGPWTVADDGTIEARHSGRVATVVKHASSADRALIAAAPSLYSTLRVIAQSTADRDNAYEAVIRFQEIARAAIAKATGEQQ